MHYSPQTSFWLLHINAQLTVVLNADIYTCSNEATSGKGKKFDSKSKASEDIDKYK